MWGVSAMSFSQRWEPMNPPAPIMQIIIGLMGFPSRSSLVAIAISPNLTQIPSPLLYFYSFVRSTDRIVAGWHSIMTHPQRRQRGSGLRRITEARVGGIRAARRCDARQIGHVRRCQSRCARGKRRAVPWPGRAPPCGRIVARLRDGPWGTRTEDGGGSWAIIIASSFVAITAVNDLC